MKTKIFSLLIAALFVTPVFSATIRGSRTGANESSAGFFVEAYAAKGRVLFKSLKFDAKGEFSLDFPTTEDLVYWVDNFPIYVKANEEIKIILPERQSNIVVIGGNPSEQKSVSSSAAVKERNVQLLDHRIDNLLVNKVSQAWADFLAVKKATTLAEIDANYASIKKLVAVSKDADLNAIASFYNDMRYLESKIQYLRANPSLKIQDDFFKFLPGISLNNAAVNTIKPIGIRSLVANYYMAYKLSKGADLKNEDLVDNASLNRMQFILDRVTNERIINEELNRSIIYHLSTKGWNPTLDKIITATIAKTTDVEGKQKLLTERERYSKVSKHTLAPDFTIPDATGKLVKLSDFRGKIVAIDVWATWCVPCMHSLPYFLKLREQYLANPDIVFVTISTDNAASKNKWLNFLKDKNMNGIDLHAGDKAASAFEKAYNITGIPRYILIDRDGKIIEDHAVQASEPEYVALLEAALKK